MVYVAQHLPFSSSSYQTYQGHHLHSSNSYTHAQA